MNKRVCKKDQIKLIMECRQSGLTDYQWCEKNGIHSGTFYNWVSKLRKKACYDIPESIHETNAVSSPKQEVVKLEIMPDEITKTQNDSNHLTCKSLSPIEIILGNAKINLTNDANPVLVQHIIQSLGNFIC